MLALTQLTLRIGAYGSVPVGRHTPPSCPDAPVPLDRLVGPHWILVKAKEILQVAIPRLNLPAYGVQFQDGHEIQAAVRAEQAKRRLRLTQCLLPAEQDLHVFNVTQRNMRQRDFCKSQVLNSLSALK